MSLSTTYTKVETDFLIQQLEKKTASGYKGDLIKTDPAPTQVGFYGLLETGIYTNLGGINAIAGNLNLASFDGTTWSLIAIEIENENTIITFGGWLNKIDVPQVNSGSAKWFFPTQTGIYPNAGNLDFTGEKQTIFIYNGNSWQKQESFLLSSDYKITSVWHDGNPITEANVDGNIYKKVGESFLVLKSFADYGEINIEDFGAVGDGKTDSTQAFIKCANFINSLVWNPTYSNDSYEIYTFTRNSPTIFANSPRGYVIKDSILFNNPVNFQNNSKILYRGNKDRLAFEFKKLYKNTIRLDIVGYPLADFTSNNYIGVIFQNAYCSSIEVGASFFTKGVVCLAKGINNEYSGFGWNELKLLNFQSCLESFVIRCENYGWANANRVIGGEFAHATGLIDYTTITRRRAFIKFETDGVSAGINSWDFHNQNFEGNLLAYPGAWETIGFDFSETVQTGINITETRFEQVNNNRIGIFAKHSSFSFKSNQYCENSQFTDEYGKFYVDEQNCFKISDSEDLSNDYKYDGFLGYVRKLDFFNTDYGIEKPTKYATNYFCQLLKIVDNSEYILAKVHYRLEIVLFDENLNVINDNVLLNKQINNMFYPSSWNISAVGTKKFIQIGSDKLHYYEQFSVIDEAKYVGILQRLTPKARIEIYTNNSAKDKILKFKNNMVDKSTFIVPTYPTDMPKINFKTGERFYSDYDFTTYVCKKSGVAANITGLKITTTNGSKSAVITGDMSLIRVGAIFNISGTLEIYTITEINGQNVKLNKNATVDHSLKDLIFNVATFENF